MESIKSKLPKVHQKKKKDIKRITKTKNDNNHKNNKNNESPSNFLREILTLFKVGITTVSLGILTLGKHTKVTPHSNHPAVGTLSCLFWAIYFYPVTMCSHSYIHLHSYFTYLWVEQKVRASIFDLNSQELFLISRRERTEQQAMWGPSLETQLNTWYKVCAETEKE